MLLFDRKLAQMSQTELLSSNLLNKQEAGLQSIYASEISKQP